MHNSIVESELQEICTFRKSILNSFSNIENKISKTKTPLKLNSSCNCKHENLSFNAFDMCSFEDQTINYFEEKDHFWAKRKNARQKIQKSDRITKYLNEYDLNNFNIDIQHLQQRKPFDDGEILFSSQTPLKNNLLSEKLINSTLQTTQIPFSNENITVLKNRRRNLSTHGNHDRTQYNDIYKQKQSNTKSKSELKWKSEQKENILTSRTKPQPQKTVTKNKTFYETSKIKLIKSKAVSTKGFLTERQLHNPIPALSAKQQMKKEIYKRIKNRIYLSLVVYKSSHDCFMAINQKELKEREDILNKIVNNTQVIKKFGRIVPKI